jgi:hypothetical protein
VHACDELVHLSEETEAATAATPQSIGKRLRALCYIHAVIPCMYIHTCPLCSPTLHGRGSKPDVLEPRRVPNGQFWRPLGNCCFRCSFAITAGIKISLSSAFPSHTFEKLQVVVTFLSVLRPLLGRDLAE